MILNSRRGALLVTAATVVLISALVGCRGFFVKPTLSSINVTPSNPNLQVGQTLQLIATGTFNDGTSGSVSGVTWSGGESHVSVSSSGLIKALANTGTSGGVTITATSGAVSGSTTVTVGASSTAITVTSNSGTTISITTNNGAQVTFTATQNGTDVTSSATWSSSNTGVISTPVAGAATLVNVGQTTITASHNGGQGSVTVTVTQ